MRAAELGLPRSLISICVRVEDDLIGMGRIVGDGGCNFEVVDIAVHPSYQRQGIGRGIVEALMSALRKMAPPTAYVSLIADRGTGGLYEEFGFRQTAPESTGMALIL